MRRPIQMLAVMLGLGSVGACASTPGPADTSDSGIILPAETLLSVDGTPHQLKDYRGEVVLLDFWATWCEPCRESLPIYNQWQKELGSDGLRIVAVSVDEDPAVARRFVQDHNVRLTVLTDPGGSWAKRFDLPTMPTAYIIGRDGRVLGMHVGFKVSEAPHLRQTLVDALATTRSGRQEASR
jgi:thiol-disulfide isomerase/thioredoxin